MMKFKLMLPLMDAVDAGSGGGGLGEIITQSIEGIGGGDEPTETPENPPVVETKTPEQDAEEKELATIEAEIRQKNPQMRGNIAVHRHQAVLTRTRNQHEKAVKEWETQRAAATKQAQEHQKALQEWEQYKWARDPELQHALRAIQLAEESPDKFVQALLQDERYASLIALKGAQETAKGGTEFPGPNAKTPDGALEYYDNEGIKSLLAWHGQQVRTEALKEMQKEMDKRFGEVKPVVEKFQMESTWNSALHEQGKVLNNARTNWPGFKEQEPQIKKALMDNPKWSLDDAYRAVVVPAFQKQGQVSEADLRKKILAEMAERKAALGDGLTPGKGAERTVDDKGKRDLGDVIRGAISSLPRE